MRMQYLVSAVPAGAVAGRNPVFCEAVADVAAIMLKARISPFCAISFLLEWQPGCPRQRQILMPVSTEGEAASTEWLSVEADLVPNDVEGALFRLCEDTA